MRFRDRLPQGMELHGFDRVQHASSSQEGGMRIDEAAKAY